MDFTISGLESPDITQFLIIEFNCNDLGYLLNIGYVSNETNTDVRMYTCRIYSSRYLDTLESSMEHELELNMHWKNAGLYTLTTKD